MIASFKRRVPKIHRTSRISSWKNSGNLLASFRYAIQGLIFATNTQRNFRIHLFFGTLAFVLAVWLNLNPLSFSILILTITSVLVLELLNTAIESVVNLSIGRRFHSLAKKAKDCAAASVLIASISSLLIACLLLLPLLLDRLGL